jgi:hypothetical protein
VFDASASTPTDGSIASYYWNFGDGFTATTTSPTTTHVYAFSGVFTATATETSPAGTSTDKVFTGQTMSRNGKRSAKATARVEIRRRHHRNHNWWEWSDRHDSE